MYQTSDKYKQLVLADNTRHLLKIYIEGNEVNPNHIFDFKVSHTLFSNDEFSLGSVTAKTIEFRIHKDSLPEFYESFYVETGVSDEIVPIGYFLLDDIGKEDDDTITIKAIDDMVKFEFNYDGSKLTFPATMLEVLQDICSKAGVECGSTSFLNDDKTIAVYDNTVSAREYLSYIAEQAGGFACIGRDGKLYIRTIGQDIAQINIKYFQKFTWGEKFKVSGVAYEDGVQDFKFGNETNNTVWMNQDNMYIVDSEQVENIYNEYADFECYSFEGTTIIDPALDVGDIVVIDDKRVIYQGNMDYVGKFKADISSKIQAKMKEQTTTTKMSDKARIRRVQSSIDQVKGEIETLVKEVDDNSEKMSQVLQTVDEITQKVENVTDLTDEINGATSITLKNCMAGDLLELHIYGNNVVFGGLYPSKTLYPSASLYPKVATSLIRVTDKDGKYTDYDLNVETVLRQSGSYRDEFVLENGKGYVIRRITLNDDGTVMINEAGTIENERDFSIKLSEGDNTIRVLNYTANLYAKWVIKNDYTDVLATKVELGSTRTQLDNRITDEVKEVTSYADGQIKTLDAKIDTTASSITQKVTAQIQDVNGNIREVDGKLELKLDTDKLISEFNAKANVITLKSDYFELTADGHIKATGGTIGGYTIGEHVLEGENAGMASNEYYSFWTKLHDETTYFVTWNGDISCKSIVVDGYGLVRTPTNEGQMITTQYIDGNQLVTTTANGIYIFLPDSVSSDEKLKENIIDTKINALEIIKQIQFKEFDWKGNGEHENLGVIAQQVEKINSDLVSDVKMLDGSSSKVFNHSKMILINAKAIQELQEENRVLRNLLNDLSKRIDKLEGGKEDE